MRTPCNSSLLNFSRFALYSKTDTFRLNLPGNILRIFHIIVFSCQQALRIITRLLVISSTCWKYVSMLQSSSHSKLLKFFSVDLKLFFFGHLSHLHIYSQACPIQFWQFLQTKHLMIRRFNKSTDNNILFFCIIYQILLTLFILS